MCVEIRIYGKNSVFFAVHKKRYHVVYVENGTVAGQELFGSKEELKLKLAVRNIKIRNGKYGKAWIKQDGCWAMPARLVLNI